MRILIIAQALRASALFIGLLIIPHIVSATVSDSQKVLGYKDSHEGGLYVEKELFLDALVADMTVSELVLQMHLMFADNIIGPNSTNELYDHATRFAPGAAIGVFHDFYPMNKTVYNEMQRLHAQKSRLNVPFMQFGECLHGVGSMKQSMFPQSIGLAASFDTELVWRVGRALGSEARAIGIHACLGPVLDLGVEPRWGRVQEAWGEDTLLTSQMGVAMSAGLSKNGAWSDPDAVVPVLKHFAAHGSSQGGINGAPSMVRGTKHVLMNMLRPFKAAIDLGFARGVMMAYSELDEIPSHVHPVLYQALDDWGFDGFITADDHGLVMLLDRHKVANTPADTIAQWFNAGGMIQYYDFPLDLFLNATNELVQNGTVLRSTLERHVRRILDVKYDLGLFKSPLIPEHVDAAALTAAHVPLTLEAAKKSIVLLENRNKTLPLNPAQQKISNIALVGPFVDTLNYGGYSGTWGSNPAENSSTLRQAMSAFLEKQHPAVDLAVSWGANTWLYNAQHNIPIDLLSCNDIPGGLCATYFADMQFSEPIVKRQEIPNRDWGLYPPPGLSSNNFSVIWEGQLRSALHSDIEGWIGVATSAHVAAALYIDGKLVMRSESTPNSTIMSNIQPYFFSKHNGSEAPLGAVKYTFVRGQAYDIRLEVQAWNLEQKHEDVQSVNSQVELFWNLVDRHDPISKAVKTAASADIIVLAVGAAWNSDGEGGDRSTLSLSSPQTLLADAIFALGIPVVLVLQGGRPFAIPEYYAQSAAVLNTFFPGQSGGEAITDVLFGLYNPGGRVPISVPSSVGTLPSFYSYKNTAHFREYLDADWWPTYPFGYGLSYTTFSTTPLTVTPSVFTQKSTIMFKTTVTNTGEIAGSHVVQVYLRQRVSSITRPLLELVAFKRVYLAAGESVAVDMELEVERYLMVVGRDGEWVLEKGLFEFVVREDGGRDAKEGAAVSAECV